MLAAVDFGSTRLKGALFEPGGEAVAHAARGLDMRRDGERAEMDPVRLSAAFDAVLGALSQRVPSAEWSALGICCQRGSRLWVDDAGAPLSPLVSFLDRREAITPPAGAKRLLSLQSWLCEQHCGVAAETAATAPAQGDAQVVEVGARVEGTPPWILAGGDKSCEQLGAGAIDARTVALSLGTAMSLGGPVAQITEAPAGVFVSPASRPGYTNVEVGLRFGGAALPWLEARVPLAAALPAQPPALLCLPFMGGSLFEDDASGAFIGLRPDTTVAEMHASLVAGLVLELRRGLQARRTIAPAPERIVLIGGAASTPHLGQWLADATGCPVQRLEDADAGLRGAAMLAAQAVGACESLEDAAARFTPRVVETLAPQAEQADAWAERAARYAAITEALFGAQGASRPSA